MMKEVYILLYVCVRSLPTKILKLDWSNTNESTPLFSTTCENNAKFCKAPGNGCLITKKTIKV